MFSVKTMLVAEKLHNESVPVCNSADQFDAEKVNLLFKDLSFQKLFQMVSFKFRIHKSFVYV